MGILELVIIAVGLSMDAFAVAVCSGLSIKKVTIKKALIIGLYFGVFQGLMPLIGYLLGNSFADKIKVIDHWIAFVLLVGIGANMVIGSFKKDKCSDRECNFEGCTDRCCPGQEEVSLHISKMLPLAIATSIDALAIGVSFAFLDVRIIPAVSSIGIITLSLSFIGVYIGNIFGSKLKNKACLMGGIILILMGCKILFEHLNILFF